MQSLRVAHRVAARVASTQVRPATPALMRANANIAGGSMGRSWADKEHAAETQFFNKKDAELLAKLAGKLQNHTAVCIYDVPLVPTSYFTESCLFSPNSVLT